VCAISSTDLAPGGQPPRLAQLNIARLVAPLDSPALAPFVEALNEVNALADAAAGFVWRFADDSGNATAVRPWGDDIVVNMSMWESVQALRDFVYGPRHAQVLRRRREWFVAPGSPHLVLWWVPAGELPTLEQARARLDLLEANGPGPAAFTLRQPFGPPP